MNMDLTNTQLLLSFLLEVIISIID